MEKLRLGYVGCGKMAQKVHIPNIYLLENECTLCGVAEVREILGSKVQKRWGFDKLYSNHMELAENKDIEAVIISGNYAIQGDIAKDLLNAGKHVLMEKPMCISIRQAQSILEAERRSGKRLMIAYMKRYDAGNELFKQKLNQFRNDGSMGKILFLRNQGILGDWIAGLDTPFEMTDEDYPPIEHNNYPDWMPPEYYKKYTNYLQQYTHNVNFIRWILDAGGGMKVKGVHLNREDGLTGIVVFDIAGITATIESVYIKCHEWNEHTAVFMENGWIKADMPTLLLRNIPAAVQVYRGNLKDKEVCNYFPERGRSWSYKNELSHFIDCIQNDKPFRSPASDAIYDINVLEEIYKQFIQNN